MTSHIAGPSCMFGGDRLKKVMSWDNQAFCPGVSCSSRHLMVLESDILEYEVKWSLGSITTKLVQVMEFQLNSFKSPKMML